MTSSVFRRVFHITCAALFTLAASGGALAQFRTIPADAKRATIRHVQGMTVELNGDRTELLAPGAQIRDAENRIILPTTLPPGSLIKFVTDMQGRVWRVWILSQPEAAQPDPKN
jgi:hypothetical protein